MPETRKIRWSIVVIAFLLSLAGAAINNLISQDPVDWIGSPPVFPKPEEIN